MHTFTIKEDLAIALAHRQQKPIPNTMWRPIMNAFRSSHPNATAMELRTHLQDQADELTQTVQSAEAHLKMFGANNAWFWLETLTRLDVVSYETIGFGPS